ncbi:LOW QUALITY PROTEIN: hypothetical protein CRUP_004447 [Coryphaenoides rupestris]|nr:LOW QUALITY PROTEIN: hypothetical protein CRUP_004447 [Coryphaenoides rupestris]
MKMVHGMQWKGQVLSVRLAKPKADPIQRKRKQQREQGDEEESRPAAKRQEAEAAGEEEEAGEPFSVQIANVVTPAVPYEEQLQRKQQEVEPFCRGWPNAIQKPKCEFLISMGADGQDKTIGLPPGEYKGGSCAVVGPAETTTSRPRPRGTTAYSVYSPETYEGHWKQLTKLEEEELDSLKSALKIFFTEGEGADSGVTSLYFDLPKPEDMPCELVAGEGHILEELLGLKFRVSPHSFFQVNTGAAEVLYSTVGEWAQLDQDSTVLDVCCGTGTIGISLAKRVRKVIGIELCQEAVEDAKHNAKLNGLTNVEFHCGKAEDVFPKILNALVSSKPHAIVDPPRAGLLCAERHPTECAAHRSGPPAAWPWTSSRRPPTWRWFCLLERVDYSAQNAGEEQEVAAVKAQ